MGRKSREKQERREQKRLEEELFRARASTREDAVERGAAEGQRRGCLICRQTDGGFRSEEHIVPESLGNVDLVLPPGVVCDRCNHEVCAPLDNALCSFLPIATLRAAYGVRSKAGKLPSVRFDNGTIEATSPNDVLLTLDSAKWHRERPAAPGRKAVSFTAKRRDLTPKRLSAVHRALAKQVLECAWLDEGEAVLGADFDHERELILHGGHHGYLMTPKRLQFPDQPETGLRYMRCNRNTDGHPFLFMLAEFWSAPVITDTLFAEPAQTPPSELLLFAF